MFSPGNFSIFICCPSARFLTADTVPLTVPADLRPQPCIDHFFLDFPCKLQEIQLFSLCQSAGIQHAMVVPVHFLLCLTDSFSAPDASTVT